MKSVYKRTKYEVIRDIEIFNISRGEILFADPDGDIEFILDGDFCGYVSYLPAKYLVENGFIEAE